MYTQRGQDGIDAIVAAGEGGWRAAALSHSQIHPDDRPAPGTRKLARQHGLADRYESWRLSVSQRLEAIDLAPDLACQIGSRTWFRGLGTMIALSALAIGFWPSFGPLEAAPAMRIDDSVRDEFRSQTIMPLALGADSGRRMGATLDVKPLRSAPERPTQQLVATLSRGDSFARMLARAGVGSGDASRVLALVGNAIATGGQA